MDLIIARHGNTFEPGETPRRVGGRTDIPLVGKGREQARALGLHLRQHELIPEVAYIGPLQRHRDTARGILDVLGVNIPIIVEHGLTEIDYGVDENKEEADVVARIGQEAIDRWNDAAEVPPGWDINPGVLRQFWHTFAQEMWREQAEKVLVVTSNGIARFALDLLPLEQRPESIKLGTGRYGHFRYDGENWQCVDWNQAPN